MEFRGWLWNKLSDRGVDRSPLPLEPVTAVVVSEGNGRKEKEIESLEV
jgi:hypothetical protein